MCYELGCIILSASAAEALEVDYYSLVFQRAVEIETVDRRQLRRNIKYFGEKFHSDVAIVGNNCYFYQYGESNEIKKPFGESDIGCSLLTPSDLEELHATYDNLMFIKSYRIEEKKQKDNKVIRGEVRKTARRVEADVGIINYRSKKFQLYCYAEKYQRI